MKILIIAEHNNQQLKSATLHTLTAASQISQDIDVMVMGYQCHAVAEQAACLPHVKRVHVADNEVYEHHLAENCTELIKTFIADTYAYVMAPATTFGKNCLPRLAGLLNTAMVSDISKIVSADTFERPIYAGNVIATVQITSPIKLLTVRTTTFAETPLGDSPTADISPLDTVISNKLTRFEKAELTTSPRPELTTARVVVAGGRGLKSADNFHLLEAIADRLQGAVGASRAAVDAGFAPNDYQVGQTGKIIAPDLYIAVGISGAIQHLAGMKESKVIVAINNDPDAPIFQIADYGLVGDLFVLLPQLKEELDKALPS